MAGQVALTVLLLAGAGAALRAFLHLTHLPLGFNPHRLLVTNIPLPERSYATWGARAAFLERLRKQVAAAPGVESAALFFGRPVDLPPATPPLMPLERMDRAGERYQPASVQQVSPSFFSTLQIPLVTGRLWSDTEHAGAAHVAVVNQRTAAQLWPHVNAIGQRIRLRQMTAHESWQVAAPQSDDPLEIIGIVGDTPNRGLHGQSWLTVYVPMTLVMGDMPSLVVRTRGEPLAMARTVQEEIHEIDPNQVIASTTSGDEVLRRAGWGREEIVASLFLVFALMGLTLASIGLSSVVSYIVSQRTREFGIRRALGAPGGNLIWRALRSTLVTVAVGTGLGVVLSLGVDRLAIQTQVNTRDPLVLVVVTSVMFAVALTATLIPAARATNVDPLVALRCD
jgi:predicted permease